MINNINTELRMIINEKLAKFYSKKKPPKWIENAARKERKGLLEGAFTLGVNDSNI
jgi:hypothetical protein